MRIEVLTGDALERALDDVALLRIQVFRDWPYLYDGSYDYERDYLETYRKSQGAVLIGAFDGDRLVGASTGTPMQDHAKAFSEALETLDLPTSSLFYCAESVLLPGWRGRGIGHRFFDLREAHARALGASHTAFCAVKRPQSHPLFPAGYKPLDPFWRKRGYVPVQGAIARFSWKDVDQPIETQKDLQFWMRALDR